MSYPNESNGEVPPASGGAPVYSVVNAQPVLGSQQCRCVCPSCHKDIVTDVEYKSGTFTWLLCGGLFLVGCAAGCCLIPFCTNGAKNATHSCPQCKSFIGTYARL